MDNYFQAIPLTLRNFQAARVIPEPSSLSSTVFWGSFRDETRIAMNSDDRILSLSNRMGGDIVYTQSDVSKTFIYVPRVLNGYGAALSTWGAAMTAGIVPEMNFVPGVNEFSLLWFSSHPISPTYYSGTYISKCGQTGGLKQYQFYRNSSLLGGSNIGGIATSPAVPNTYHKINILRVNKTHRFERTNGVQVDNSAIGTAGPQIMDCVIGARRNDTNTDYGFYLSYGYNYEIVIANKFWTDQEAAMLENYCIDFYGIRGLI